MLLAALLAGAAALTRLARPQGSPMRLRRLSPAGSALTGLRAKAAVGTPHAAALLAGLGAGVLIGGPAGFGLGLVLAVLGPPALSKLEPAKARADRDRLVAEVPLALDLLAACLAGGAGPGAASAAVAAALPGPCGARLEAVAAALAVGTPPAQAWAALSRGDPADPLASLSRLLSRAVEGGAPVAAAMARVASDARAAALAQGERSARRLGVLLVAPLGLCFLPAFVLIGIVPVVIGLAAPMLAAY